MECTRDCATCDLPEYDRLYLVERCEAFEPCDLPDTAENLAVAAALGDEDFDAYVAAKFSAAGPDDLPF